MAPTHHAVEHALPTPTRAAHFSALAAAGGESAEAVLSQPPAQRHDLLPVIVVVAVAVARVEALAHLFLCGCAVSVLVLGTRARREHCLQKGVQVEQEAAQLLAAALLLRVRFVCRTCAAAGGCCAYLSLYAVFSLTRSFWRRFSFGFSLCPVAATPASFPGASCFIVSLYNIYFIYSFTFVIFNLRLVLKL